MAILSKILSEEIPSPHHLAQYRILFLGSSIFSLIMWIITLVYNRRKTIERNRLDQIIASYLTNRDKRKSKESFRKTIGKLWKILGEALSISDICYASGIAVALGFRTICDLWMIQNGTQIEAAIISSDYRKLKFNIMEFLFAAPILALINNGLKYCIDRLQLNIRCKIRSYLTGDYIRGQIDMVENRFANIDKLLANDVDKFSQTLVEVYSNIAKPLLDIFIYLRKLSKTYTGFLTPSVMTGYLIIAAGVLVRPRRPFTVMTFKENQLESILRYMHSRLISNCEEIVFYQGNKHHENVLDRLRENFMRMLVFKFNVDYLDNIITRYAATVCGYLALSIPFLGDRYLRDNQTERLETYYKSGHIMMNLVLAIGRLITAVKDLNRLVAYTNRVDDLIRYMDSKNDRFPLKPLAGQIEYCLPSFPMIQMIDVPLCTPTGQVLVESLNFEVALGQNVLITGPNGSGKSSLFRLLGELWPLYGGKLIKPENERLFYIPQKPYMSLGTFRDQIIYPDTCETMRDRSMTDDDLIRILDTVHLRYLVERETLDIVQDWQDVLSSGEKQRIAIARLIYHRAQFAILDECTSAIEIDIERCIFRSLIEMKFCSLLTVTRRTQELLPFHHYILEFDGKGNVRFEKIDDQNNINAGDHLKN